MKRRCSKCKQTLETTSFYKDRSRFDCLDWWCKECRLSAGRNRYQRNSEKLNAKSRVWREKNLEYVREYDRQRLKENRTEINARRRELYPTRREKVLARNKKYCNENKEKLTQWRKDNRHRITEYRRHRYENDPRYRLENNLRSRLHHALARTKTKKTINTLDLLGCSSERFMLHIERQFKPGMTWKNHGIWNVDHIRPCASFDLTKESEQRACFHYSNLQPLWAEENFKKHARYSAEEERPVPQA